MSLNEYQIDLGFQEFTSSLMVTEKSGMKYIFDPIRKKYLILQPEEMVRQLLIQWLIKKSTFSRNAIQVEKLVSINNLRKRFDILIYDKFTKPHVLIECKSPAAIISQHVFDQVSVYNTAMKAPFLIVTNGPGTWIARQNLESERFEFYSEPPEWLIGVK